MCGNLFPTSSEKNADVNSGIRAALPEEARIQQLQNLQKRLIDAGDMVRKKLEPDQLLAHGLFVSVDKTQGKVKPSWPLEKASEKCAKERSSLISRRRAPLQS